MAMTKFGDAKVISVMDPKTATVQETCPECHQPTARPMSREAYLQGEKATRQCAKCGKPYKA